MEITLKQNAVFIRINQNGKKSARRNHYPQPVNVNLLHTSDTEYIFGTDTDKYAIAKTDAVCPAIKDTNFNMYPELWTSPSFDLKKLWEVYPKQIKSIK